MDHRIFMDRDSKPTEEDLKPALGRSHALREEIREYVLERYLNGREEWNFPGRKCEWSFRIKDIFALIDITLAF